MRMFAPPGDDDDDEDDIKLLIITPLHITPLKIGKSSSTFANQVEHGGGKAHGAPLPSIGLEQQLVAELRGLLRLAI